MQNTSPLDGDEVLMVYHSVGAEIRNSVNHPVPFRKLVDFDRMSVSSKGVATASFSISQDQLSITNADGDYVLYPGNHHVCVNDGGATDLFCTTVIVA